MTAGRQLDIKRHLPLLLLLIFAVLLFKNLGNIYLWQDEAGTALKSRSIATHFVPMHTDGTNIFKNAPPHFQLPGNLRANYHSWGQHYLVFLSLWILGENTFAARFPFASFGFLAGIYFYVFCTKHLASKEAALIALTLFVFSVPLLLHLRQCRYFAPTLFFVIASTDAYLCLRHGKRWALPYFVVMNVILFNFHYGVSVSFWGGLLLHWIFSKGWKRERGKFLLGLALTALANLPMVLFAYTYIWDRGGGDLIPPELRPSQMLSVYIMYYINSYIAPLILLAALPLIGIRNRSVRVQEFKGSSLFVWIILSHLGLLTVSGYHTFFRNLVPIIPFFLILLAQLFRITLGKSKPLGTVMIVLFLTTNIFSLPGYFFHPSQPTRPVKPKVRFPLADYLYEITHDYDGPIEGIVQYLKKHAHAGDTVVTNYGDLPLMFYTDLKVLGGYGEVGIADLPHYRRLGVKVVEKPDWIIPRSRWPINPRYIQLAKDHRYRLTEIDAVDLLFENRPSPLFHKYRTVTKGSNVKILQLVK